jgi:hypothetical protein
MKKNWLCLHSDYKTLRYKYALTAPTRALMHLSMRWVARRKHLYVWPYATSVPRTNTIGLWMEMSALAEALVYVPMLKVFRERTLSIWVWIELSAPAQARIHVPTLATSVPRTNTIWVWIDLSAPAQALMYDSTLKCPAHEHYLRMNWIECPGTSNDVCPYAKVFRVRTLSDWVWIECMNTEDDRFSTWCGWRLQSWKAYMVHR